MDWEVRRHSLRAGLGRNRYRLAVNSKYKKLLFSISFLRPDVWDRDVGWKKGLGRSLIATGRRTHMPASKVWRLVAFLL